MGEASEFLCDPDLAASVTGSAARAFGVTCAAPRPPARTTRRLAGGIGQMEAIIADKPRALDAQPSVAHWHLGNAQQHVPIEPHHPLPFAAFDQHLITLHGDK